MVSGHDSSDLGRLVRRWSQSRGEALAQATAAARQLALSPSPGPLTAVSVEATTHDLVGRPTRVLWVLRDGIDRAVAEPDDFVALNLSRIDELLEAERINDEGREAELNAARLSPHAPTAPNVALMHAAIPARYVEQSQPVAMSALAVGHDAADAIRGALGDSVLFLPEPADVAPCVLRRAWAAHEAEHGKPPRAVVDGDGALYTFGPTPGQCAETREELVERAESSISKAGGKRRGASRRTPERREERRRVALALRGAMQRATGRWWIAHWTTADSVLWLCEPTPLARLREGGWPCAAHASWLGSLPLLFDEAEALDGSSSPKEIDAALSLRAALPPVGDGAAAASAGRSAREGALPSVVLVPEFGAICFGRTLLECRTRAAMLEHAAAVLASAIRLGGRPSPRAESGIVSGSTAPEHEAAPATDASPHRRACTALPPLLGRVVLLTGADSGIGVATTRALLEAGAHLVITADDARVAEAIGEQYRDRYPGRLVVTSCDVTSDVECQAAVRLACDSYGGVDILVSNASTAPSGALHSDGGDAALRMSLDVNLLGHQRAARSAAEVMLLQGSGGVLLFNASKSAFVQGPAFGPYAVPKAALVALMRQYAIDLGPEGIRSNAVNADRVHMKPAAPLGPHPSDEERELMPSEYFRSNLLGRETTPESVADAFVYLATAESTTGCVITVDGGNPGAFPR